MAKGRKRAFPETAGRGDGEKGGNRTGAAWAANEAKAAWTGPRASVFRAPPTFFGYAARAAAIVAAEEARKAWAAEEAGKARAARAATAARAGLPRPDGRLVPPCGRPCPNLRAHEALCAAVSPAVSVDPCVGCAVGGRAPSRGPACERGSAGCAAAAAHERAASLLPPGALIDPCVGCAAGVGRMSRASGQGSAGHPTNRRA